MISNKITNSNNLNYDEKIDIPSNLIDAMQNLPKGSPDRNKAERDVAAFISSELMKNNKK